MLLTELLSSVIDYPDTFKKFSESNGVSSKVFGGGANHRLPKHPLNETSKRVYPVTCALNHSPSLAKSTYP